MEQPILLGDVQSREEQDALERLLLEALDDPRPNIEVTAAFWAEKRQRLIDRARRRSESELGQ
jgi:hypothetical protein